jgi:hypothetical protein
MREMGSFVATLARARISQKEINRWWMQHMVTRPRELARLTISSKPSKEGKTNLISATLVQRRGRWTDDVVMSIIAAVDRVPADNICELAAMHGLMFGTVRAILTDNLGLVKSPLQDPQAVVNRLKTGESGVQQRILRPHSTAVIGGPQQHCDDGRVHHFFPNCGDETKVDTVG